jgi:hypothetical protein
VLWVLSLLGGLLLEACSIRVQQFGGKQGQSWKVAEKLKESDSYVILCV